MFQQTFVDGVHPTKKQYTVMMSLLLQVVVVGVLTVLPLVYTAAAWEVRVLRTGFFRP